MRLLRCRVRAAYPAEFRGRAVAQGAEDLYSQIEVTSEDVATEAHSLRSRTSRVQRRWRPLDHPSPGRADYPTSRRIVRTKPAASGTATQNTIENKICGT